MSTYAASLRTFRQTTGHRGDRECLELIVVTVIFIQNNTVKFEPPLNISAEAPSRFLISFIKRKDEENDNIEGLLVLYQKKKKEN